MHNWNGSERERGHTSMAAAAVRAGPLKGASSTPAWTSGVPHPPPAGRRRELAPR